MRFSKGTVKNINKKLLTGTLALILLTTPLVGCSNSGNNFEYIKNEQGIVENVGGTVNYKYLKNCYFTVIEDTKFETTEFYVTERFIEDGTVVNSRQTYCYVDILTDREVFKRRVDSSESADEINNKVIMTEIKLEDYLYELEKVKDSYTNEEVEEILEIIKEKYVKINNKQLVKE